MHTYYENPVYRILDLVLGIISALIGLRVILKIVAANPATPFVSWIYSLSGVLVSPFAGILPNQSVSGSVLDISAIVALTVYALGFYLISSLIQAFQVRNTTHTHKVVEIEN